MIMFYRRHRALAVVWIGALPVGCALEHPTREHAPPKPATWPAQLAGRNLQIVTDDYALYAVNPQEAGMLDKWLQREIGLFQENFDCPFQTPGLVLSMEPGDEPAPAIESWRLRHADRSKRIWYGRRRSYSVFRRPFFRESFALPAEQLEKLDLLTDGMPMPAWTCFLCTDQHLRDEFSQKHAKQMQAANAESDEVLAKMPLGLRLHQRVALGMFRTMAAVAWPIYCSIDIDLMCLQRRETLYRTLLDAADLTDTARVSETQRLRKRIDKKWTRHLKRRPGCGPR